MPDVEAGREQSEGARFLSVLERLDRGLGEVEHALRRLDEGTYGSCEACGRPLGDDRLAADPVARMCPEHEAAG